MQATRHFDCPLSVLSFIQNFCLICHQATPEGDNLPALYHSYKDSEKTKNRTVIDPTDDTTEFIRQDFSLGGLYPMLNHLWLAGNKRPTAQLHLQIAMGRDIAVSERMDYHLLWTDGKINLKPIPRYILSSGFWETALLCPLDCTCKPQNTANSCNSIRGVALGFLYTYMCLISSELDFRIANEKYLLPREDDGTTIRWTKWKEFSREFIRDYDPKRIHQRFHYAELRISRLFRLPPFNPYVAGWHTYRSFLCTHLSWIATGTIFIVLILTAMQVGLATDRLQSNEGFQYASYVFTIFAVLAPICAFGLVVLSALLNLLMALPWFLTQSISEAE
ncbi:hypothetical protein F4811DRAFT_573643 [Daldinia bambusicola]|nr:hypothetical protein F4811DRAFT_573643 [Daldinia bambusicola]